MTSFPTFFNGLPRSRVKLDVPDTTKYYRGAAGTVERSYSYQLISPRPTSLEELQENDARRPASIFWSESYLGKGKENLHSLDLCLIPRS